MTIVDTVMKLGQKVREAHVEVLDSKVINQIVDTYVACYGNLAEKYAEIPYDVLWGEFAYIYNYMAHKSAILLNWLRENKNALIEFFKSRNSIDFLAYGGGSGADLLALIEFISEHKIICEINYHLVDKNQSSWREVSNLLVEIIKEDYNIEINFQCHNDLDDIISKIDIVSFSYVLR